MALTPTSARADSIAIHNTLDVQLVLSRSTASTALLLASLTSLWSAPSQLRAPRR